MNQNELTQLAEVIFDSARDNLVRDGHLSPVALIMTDRDMVPVVLSSEEGSSERDLMLALKDKIAEVGGKAVVIIREGWAVTRSADETVDLGKIVPSQDPERMDAIMLYASSPTYTFSIQQTFVKQDDTGAITFGEKVTGEPELLNIPEGLWGEKNTILH